ncbi:hypothetical protein MRX96_029012 [Rhipicephalus microplus]
MYLTPEGRRLAGRLLDRRHSSMGQHPLEYSALVPEQPHCGWLPIPPHQDPGLGIMATIPGTRLKKNTPQSALHQEALTMIEERLAGRILLYKTARLQEMVWRQPLVLPHPSASARTAGFPSSAAVMCDSRAALLTLARAERGALVAQRLARKFVVIVPSGCDVVFQCEPSHVGTTCKRDSGRPRQEGSPPQHTRLSVHPRGRCCDLRIARQVRALHPHSRVATGNPPRPLPKTGISRHARAFLLWLRTECFRTAERRFRFTNSGSPSCAKCLAVETTEHILLECPGYIEQRQRLFDAYERLGLQYVSLDHLRFPQAHRSRLMRAFEAPLEFFGDADLITCL